MVPWPGRVPTIPRAHTQVALVSPSLSAGSAGKPQAPPSRQTDTRGPGDTSVGACGMLQAPKAGRAAQTGERCLRRKVERQQCMAHQDHVGSLAPPGSGHAVSHCVPVAEGLGHHADMHSLHSACTGCPPRAQAMAYWLGLWGCSW